MNYLEMLLVIGTVPLNDLEMLLLLYEMCIYEIRIYVHISWLQRISNSTL